MLRNLIIAIAVFAMASGCTPSGKSQQDSKAAVFHLTRWQKEPHHLLHPLMRAKHFAEAGIKTVIFLDVDAHELGFKDGGTIKYEELDARTVLKEAQDKGAKVLVCHGCMKRKGKTEKDLIEGAAVATPESFFNLAQETIVFDY